MINCVIPGLRDIILIMSGIVETPTISTLGDVMVYCLKTCDRLYFHRIGEYYLYYNGLSRKLCDPRIGG